MKASEFPARGQATVELRWRSTMEPPVPSRPGCPGQHRPTERQRALRDASAAMAFFDRIDLVVQCMHNAWRPRHMSTMAPTRSERARPASRLRSRTGGAARLADELWSAFPAV